MSVAEALAHLRKCEHIFKEMAGSVGNEGYSAFAYNLKLNFPFFFKAKPV